MNVKKISTLFAVVMCAAALSALDIETALRQSAEYFSSSQYVKKGSTIAIMGISSGTKKMSDFMLDEMTLDFLQSRKFTVTNVESQKSAGEADFRLSEELDKNVIQKIGSVMGANFVIHGRMLPIYKNPRVRNSNLNYNLVIQAFDVTTAAVVDACKFTVAPNVTTVSLLREGEAVKSSNKRYGGDLELLLGLRSITLTPKDSGNSSRDLKFDPQAAFLVGLRNFNLFSINDAFSVGFFESLAGGGGSSLASFHFVIGPAVGINIKNVVKLQTGFGLSSGIDAGSFTVKSNSSSVGYSYIGGPYGFALHATAKLFPSKRFSPFLSIQGDWSGGNLITTSGSYGYGSSSYSGSKDFGIQVNAFEIATGFSLNFGRR